MVWVQWTPSGLRDTTRLFSHLTQDPGETSGLPLPPRGGAHCKASLAAKPERGREVRGCPRPQGQPRPPAPHQPSAARRGVSLPLSSVTASTVPRSAWSTADAQSTSARSA